MRFAIQRMLAALIFGGVALGQNPAPPDAAAQDRLLESMHEYADRYVSNLPNFVCDQVTRASEAGPDGAHWHKGDTLISRLSFHDGREQRTLESVNGKKVKPGGRGRVLPLNTEGEFGMLLGQVLGKQSQAYFQWNRWENVGAKPLAVFDFGVDKESSRMTLRLSDGASAVVSYKGLVYADPATGRVERISYTAKDIPARIQTREISTTVKYGENSIGTKTYLLPLEATVTSVLWTRQIRNELEFRGYRKFEADSSISFGDVDSPAK